MLGAVGLGACAVLLVAKCGWCRPSSDYERLPLYNELDMRESQRRPSEEQVKEEALLAARFYLRGKAFTLVEHHDKIGSRRNKHYFSVKANADGSTLLMTVVFTDLRMDRNIFADVLVGLRSHFALSVIDAEYVEEKKMAVTFRRPMAKGSLRDLLCDAKWIHPYALKYGRRKVGAPFTEVRIATWGRHILEGINYLRLKGLPAGHIHAGNVVVENNVAKITDFENKLMPSLKPALLSLIQHEACAGLDPDVACFGAILFEMATGFPMDTVDLTQRPARVPASIMAVLDSIFYSGSRMRPTLELLLETTVFAKVEMPDLAPLPRTRLGAKAKEALRECRRMAPAGGAEVKKPPRVAVSTKLFCSFVFCDNRFQPRPHRYADTPLAVGKPVAAVAVAAQPPKPAAAAAVAAPAPAPAPAAAATPRAAPAAPKAPAAPAKVAPVPAAPAAPAPPAPSAPPPPPPPAPKAPVAASGRGGLLSSIQGFKGGLKKVVTLDKSKPVFK